MKKTILHFVLISFFVTISSAWGLDSSKVEDSQVSHKVIYENVIDNKIAFYQNRIYLTDCDCRILRDIGNDAVIKVIYLKAFKPKLINDMLAKNIKLDRSSMHSFLGTKINNIKANMLASTNN